METNNENIDDDSFYKNLMSNQLKVPNEFTILMGKLIREARENFGLTQSDLAKNMGNRPATISDIENGKSEIGVLTLVKFAIIFHKPISYFFPEAIFKDRLVDVKTPFEHEVLDKARMIEEFGDIRLTSKLLNLLSSYYFDDYNRHLNGYPDDEALF
jgi:transcriptional regulator with XRE-family HTH domain